MRPRHLALLILLLILGLIALCSCDGAAYQRHYKYEIEFTDGKYSHSDYTNAIEQLPDGCIRYREVFENVTRSRCGTFSITEY